MYEFQKHALYDSIMSVHHCNGTSSWGFSPCLNIFFMLEDTKQGSWLVAQSLSSSYTFELKCSTRSIRSPVLAVNFVTSICSPVAKILPTIHKNICYAHIHYKNISDLFPSAPHLGTDLRCHVIDKLHVNYICRL